MTPKLSIIMPVYNSQEFLKETIESILNQSFKDFELLILNDNSSDNSKAIILEYASNDSRILYFEENINIGPSEIRNKGIDLAKGKYIALNDSDDISNLYRFEKQIAILDKDEKIGLCASWYTEFGENIKNNLIKSVANHEDIKIAFLTYDCIGNSTIMFRKSSLGNLRFDSNFKVCEDYKLWSQLLLKTNFQIIPESLVKYRVHNNGISKLKHHLISEYDKIIKKDFYKETLEVTTNTELENTFKIFNREKNLPENVLTELLETAEVLLTNNKKNKNFNLSKFEKRVFLGLTKSIKKGRFSKNFLKKLKTNYTHYYKSIPIYLKILFYLKTKN